jgi:hypothetical protein
MTTDILPTERSYLIKLAAWLLSPESSRAIDAFEENTHIGRNQFAKAQAEMREIFCMKALEIRRFVDDRGAAK